MPGTHSKWFNVVDGRIQAFTTTTGEFFAVRNHLILGRFAGDGESDPAAARAALLRGVDAARNADGLAPVPGARRASTTSQAC